MLTATYIHGFIIFSDFCLFFLPHIDLLLMCWRTLVDYINSCYPQTFSKLYNIELRKHFTICCLSTIHSPQIAWNQSPEIQNEIIWRPIQKETLCFLIPNYFWSENKRKVSPHLASTEFLQLHLWLDYDAQGRQRDQHLWELDILYLKY